MSHPKQSIEQIIQFKSKGVYQQEDDRTTETRCLRVRQVLRSGHENIELFFLLRPRFFSHNMWIRTRAYKRARVYIGYYRRTCAYIYIYMYVM